MSIEQVRQKVLQSKALVDVQQPHQTGLTMRTFEALAARKKLITTNDDVKSYDFYHPNNVMVIDKCAPQSIREFMDAPYYDMDPAFTENYSVYGWLNTVLALP